MKSKLRAIPGSGQEWLVLNEQDLIIATFHGLRAGSDEPQKMAESFAEFWNKEAELDRFIEQLGADCATGAK